jgi:hypothetical protein
MARTSATISVGADTRQLEKDIQSALSRDFKFKGFNEKAFTQPLGRITGASNEFQKSLDASNARVIAFGASAGAIDLILENTIAPTFIWTGPNSFTATTEDIAGLSAGTYSVTVTDGLCTATGTQEITNTDGPSATLSLSNDTICNGTDVILTVQLTGVAPFTFTYNDGTLPVTVTAFDGTTYLATVTPSVNTTFTVTYTAHVQVFNGSLVANNFFIIIDIVQDSIFDFDDINLLDTKFISLSDKTIINVLEASNPEYILNNLLKYSNT